MGCFALLRPAMPGIMQELIGQLDPEPKFEFVSASNNAAWSVGEVSLRYGRGMFFFVFVSLTFTELSLQTSPNSNNGSNLSFRGSFLFFCTLKRRGVYTRMPRFQSGGSG